VIHSDRLGLPYTEEYAFWLLDKENQKVLETTKARN
jgi:hypothetical protein